MAPTTKDVVVDAVLGSAWVNRNPQQVKWTGADRSTPCNICHAVSIVEPPSPVLIGIVANSPPCGLNMSQQVANKRKSISPGLFGQTQKLYAAVDGIFSDDLDLAYFSAR